MVAPISKRSGNSIQFTEYGIPVRNLWHMLLYAWGEVPLKEQWVLEYAERAPSLDALFASVLVKLMRGRMRLGLGRSYVDQKGSLRGIRGKVDFSESLKHHTFERGESYSRFQEHSANDPRNQIIRSTLVRLAQAGQFGPRSDSANEVRNALRRLARDLHDIELIEVTPELIQKVKSLHHDRDYRLMLAICNLILERQMPLESHGAQAFPALDRDALVLHNVYERFVANFYRIHLTSWKVTAQKRLEWHAKVTSEQLPSMVPDLVLQERSSGRLFILDTKFTAHSLIENQWGKPKLDSSHLYQLYAYLKSQEHLSERHRTATGILLYPAVQSNLSERLELQDHVLMIESVDLAAPWQEIEDRLLDLIAKRAM